MHVPLISELSATRTCSGGHQGWVLFSDYSTEFAVRNWRVWALFPTEQSGANEEVDPCESDDNWSTECHDPRSIAPCLNTDLLLTYST